MPLPASIEREELHQRQVTMRAYHRADGLFDVEARLVDTKTVSFIGPLSTTPLAAGEPIHDLWIRLVIDLGSVIHEAVAVSDSTPFGVCKEASETLSVLKGVKIGQGWNRIIRERLGGRASCTHLVELLSPMATTAFQTLWPFKKGHPEKLDAHGRPLKVDSCYAYASDREVVMKLWPLHYDGPK